MRMSSLVAVALFAVLPSDLQAAQTDYARQRDPYVRYLSLSDVPQDERPRVEAAMKYAIPAASSKTNLDQQIPEKLPGTSCYRINLQYLGWRWQDYIKIAERDPYSNVKNPLVVRGDWFLTELADTTESDAYYRLLYGKKIPKTRDEFLAFWGVDQKQQDGLELGWIETRSQVSKQGTRFIRRFLSNRGTVWSTQDVLAIERKNDPLEFPDGIFKHDGEESIAMTPKVSVRAKTRGSAMAFLLSNGEGKRVEEAPVDLVEDHQRTIRSQAAIINNGSCIGCHVHGLHSPSANGVETLLTRGVQLYAKDKDKQEFAERFHLGTKGLNIELTRANEDYAAFIQACNGLTPVKNAEAYRTAMRSYEADLDLARAAFELGATAKGLTQAIAFANAHKLDLGNRAAGIVYGERVPRTTFESEYHKLRIALQTWRDQ
jgi:hypothetical protein